MQNKVAERRGSPKRIKFHPQMIRFELSNDVPEAAPEAVPEPSTSCEVLPSRTPSGRGNGTSPARLAAPAAAAAGSGASTVQRTPSAAGTLCEAGASRRGGGAGGGAEGGSGASGGPRKRARLSVVALALRTQRRRSGSKEECSPKRAHACVADEPKAPVTGMPAAATVSGSSVPEDSVRGLHGGLKAGAGDHGSPQQGRLAATTDHVERTTAPSVIAGSGTRGILGSGEQGQAAGGGGAERGGAEPSCSTRGILGGGEQGDVATARQLDAAEAPTAGARVCLTEADLEELWKALRESSADTVPEAPADEAPEPPADIMVESPLHTAPGPPVDTELVDMTGGAAGGCGGHCSRRGATAAGGHRGRSTQVRAAADGGRGGAYSAPGRSLFPSHQPSRAAARQCSFMALHHPGRRSHARPDVMTSLHT